jgi:hypothetical protein
MDRRNHSRRQAQDITVGVVSGRARMFAVKDLEETSNMRTRMLALVRQQVKLKSDYYD